MKCRVGHVVEWMEELAPPSLAEQWDAVGLQLGDAQAVVRRVMLALTVTPAVVAQAVQQQAQLIVAHHPVLFRPAAQVRWDRPQGALLRQLIGSDTNVFIAHTNYDKAARGTSLVLCQKLGIHRSEPMLPEDDGLAGLGRIGDLPASMSPDDFSSMLMDVLQTPALVQCGPRPTMVNKVAVLGGSGGSYISHAAQLHADVYVTGDVDFHDALTAESVGLWVVDAGHFATERIIVSFWQQYLQACAEEKGMAVQFVVADESDPLAIDHRAP